MKSLFATFAAVLLFSACSGGRSPAPLTTAPTPAPTPATTTIQNVPNWAADAIVVSSTGAGCGWGIQTGDTRNGVFWRITRTGDSVTLDEDTPNWPTDDVPYSGQLNGMHFVANDVESGGGVCAFRGGDLSGSFSDDGLTFEAMETLRWGSVEHSVVVQRHWSGRRLEP